MKILLCSVPDGSLDDTLKPFIAESQIRPVAIWRLLDWMEKKKGWNGDIYDINSERPSDKVLEETFKKLKPDVVGLSATLSHCYPNIKRISNLLRKIFPDIWIVAGGHATSSSNVILDKTATDICVVGDGEIPWVQLLDYFESNPDRKYIDYNHLLKIKGLAFCDANNNLKVNGYAEQVPGSELQYPNYDKIKKNLGEKGETIYNLFAPFKSYYNRFPHVFTKENINKNIASLETSKGCVARCTFCQRYTKGYKIYELNNLESHIRELKDKFNVIAFRITDENFGSNKKQAYDLARIMKKCGVHWMAGGRCTTFTAEDIKFYSEHNCVDLAFGIESGSQKILDIMEKKFTKQDVFNAISNCKKNGLTTYPDALMLGMPGETEETVKESAQFIASLRFELGMDWSISSPFWAMAIPGTPLYEYSQQIGVIGKTLEEEEDYLYRIAEQKTNFLNYVNKTGSTIKECHFWMYLFEYEAKIAYVKLIFNSKENIKNKMLQLHDKCLKGEIKDFLKHLKDLFEGNLKKLTLKHKQPRKTKFIQKIKWFTLIFINFSLSISALIIPSFILIPIVRVYANMRFNLIGKKYKMKNGKQIYNLFVQPKTEFNNKFRVNESRVAETKRQIERSLRAITMENRKYIKPAETVVEKSLETLATGQ